MAPLRGVASGAEIYSRMSAFWASTLLSNFVSATVGVPHWRERASISSTSLVLPDMEISTATSCGVILAA